MEYAPIMTVIPGCKYETKNVAFEVWFWTSAVYPPIIGIIHFYFHGETVLVFHQDRVGVHPPCKLTELPATPRNWGMENICCQCFC